MADYDREFLEGEGASLLRRARGLVMRSGFWGSLLGALGGTALGGALVQDGVAILFGTGMGGGAGLLIGVLHGEGRARLLRLQAHTLLVQVEIERHLAALVAREH